MKIALVTTFFGAHRFGGDAAYVERLAEALLRRGHSVTVFYSRDAFEAVRGTRQAIAYSPPLGLRVHALSSRLSRPNLLWMHQTGGLGATGRELVDHLQQGAFDVTHFHNISLVGGAALLRECPGPAVRLMTAHEHWLTCPLSVLWRYNREACEDATCTRCTLRSGRPPQLWRRSGSVSEAVAGLDALIFPSHHTLEAHARRGIHHPRAQVLPYFIPRHWELPEPPPPASAHAPFRFIGRLVAEKGLQTLIPIFRARPAATLEITGDGPFRAELESLAAGASNIRFRGAASAEDIRTLLPNTRALLVPSLFPETFGYVLIEAWSQAIPTLASTAGALPEVSGAGGGWVCDSTELFGTRIDQFLASPELGREQGVALWKKSRDHFSEDSHLAAWEAIVRGSGVAGSAPGKSSSSHPAAPSQNEVSSRP